MRQTKKERNLDIVEHYDSGLTYEQIGKIYGLTRERIRQIIDETGYPGRRGNGQLSVPSDEVIDQMREKLRKSSLSDVIRSETLTREQYRAALYLRRTKEYKKICEERRAAKDSERRSIVTQMISEGCRQYEIAERIGVSIPYVTRLKMQWGMIRPHIKKDVYKTLYKKGLSVKEISQQVNRSPVNVRIMLQRAGLM
tara:strand:+ start:714 stop:1304 length:591 start_codon:yes stop_codon:yes gene_type:complete